LRHPDEQQALRRALDWADSLSQQKYDSPLEHFQANQYALLIRKNPSLEIQGLDPESVAKEKFLASEQACRETNLRFRTGALSAKTELLLERARRWIEYVISSSPNLNEVYDRCDFGPGASIGVHGNATNSARKILSETWSCTPCAKDYVKQAMHGHAQLAEHIYSLSMWREGVYCLDETSFDENFEAKVKSVDYNKIVFVPKTVKTHRSIAVEPLLNSFIQKGIDETLRLRLRRVGIDLSDQEFNKRLAKLGSIGNVDTNFSTIDLSSASDSISIELVRRLLPPDWFLLMNCTRSPSFLLDGEYSRFEKFCSMGNGFCFPLQTLIYASLVHSLDPSVVFGKDGAVYGDDIIVLPHVASPLIEVLREVGFQTNVDKTFIEGPFRESCGADWYLGVDVRPYTLDFRIENIQSAKPVRSGRKQRYLSRFVSQPLLVTESTPAVPGGVEPDGGCTAKVGRALPW
jgi:hypothetical protein